MIRSSGRNLGRGAENVNGTGGRKVGGSEFTLLQSRVKEGREGFLLLSFLVSVWMAWHISFFTSTVCWFCFDFMDGYPHTHTHTSLLWLVLILVSHSRISFCSRLAFYGGLACSLLLIYGF